MNKVYRNIINVFVMSLAISMAFSFSALAAGRLEIRAKPGSRVHLYRAGMVDANGKASVYDWYSDVDDVSELSDEELAAMISSHFNTKYEDKVGTFRVGSDGSVVFNDIMDAVYYIRSDGMEPVAVILPGKDAQTGGLSYDVTVTIGDTELPEAEAADETNAAESESAAESEAAESEAAVETEAEESEAAVETSGTPALPEEQGTDVSEETTMISESETAVQESAPAEQESVPAAQDKPAAAENETTAPHAVGTLMIAALLMALAVAAVTVITRIRRKQADEKRRAAREARLRAWKESRDAEEETEDSEDRV